MVYFESRNDTNEKKKKVGEEERRDYEIKQKGTQQNNVKAFYNIPYNK